MYGWKRFGVAEREEGGWGKCRGGWLSTKIGKYVVGFGTHTQMVPHLNLLILLGREDDSWNGGGYAWLKEGEADGGDEGRGESKTSF